MSLKIIPITIIFFLSVSAVSQTPIEKDIELLSTSFNSVTKKEVARYPVNLNNELSMILTASYHFYKSYISSQDANNCAFHPSCSTYAVETIKTNGLLGIFDAFDRLTRCNGFSPEKYNFHNNSKHFHDPVKKIH